MSTTLVPPSYYLVKPRGHAARVYDTLADVASAIGMLAGTPATITVLTGSRRRSLSDAELLDLGQHVRTLRLHARSRSSPVPVAAAKKPGVSRR